MPRQSFPAPPTATAGLITPLSPRDQHLPDANQYWPARFVWKRFNITPMSLYRWLKDEKLGFPQPIYFGRFRYFVAAEIIAWEARQPRGRREPEAA